MPVVDSSVIAGLLSSTWRPKSAPREGSIKASTQEKINAESSVTANGDRQVNNDQAVAERRHGTEEKEYNNPPVTGGSYNEKALLSAAQQQQDLASEQHSQHLQRPSRVFPLQVPKGLCAD